MGPEPIMGLVSWLGVLLCVAVAAGLLKKSTRLYAAVLAAPGILMALLSVEGQVGFARVIGGSLMFFAVGSLLVGLPVAALLWFWLRYRVTKPGTLQ